jgi:peroxiredoxin
MRLPTALLLVAFLGACDSGRPLLQIGEKAPPFNLQLVSGETVSLSQYAGKGLMITFMSSWCPCSNDSMPMMKKAYQDYKDDIAFLMIGIQDGEEKFINYTKKWQVPFSAGYDEDDEIARSFGVRSPPTTIFIDKTGIVKRAFYGNIKDKSGEFSDWFKAVL